jgi:hypothetical protein
MPARTRLQRMGRATGRFLHHPTTRRVGRIVGRAAAIGAGGATVYAGIGGLMLGRSVIQLGLHQPIRMVVRNVGPGLIRRGAVLAGHYSRASVLKAVGTMGLGAYIGYRGARGVGAGARLVGHGLRKAEPLHGPGQRYGAGAYGGRGAFKGRGRGWKKLVRRSGAAAVGHMRSSIQQKYGRAR